ncbi:contact-dependent growth inhibition system immunity protein [Rubrivivax gelatinosus]|uniref:contact-dependent growth inhibition system immunity protein n=1 Tax=Rubrivivax gelatinosus TaxID=28068 RepID=UPI003D316FE8
MPYCSPCQFTEQTNHECSRTALDAFLEAWPHQDCRLNDETPQNIAAEYCGIARDEDSRALQRDIERFLNGLETEVDLDIIPAAFAANGEDLVRTIYRPHTPVNKAMPVRLHGFQHHLICRMHVSASIAGLRGSRLMAATRRSVLGRPTAAPAA